MSCVLWFLVSMLCSHSFCMSLWANSYTLDLLQYQLSFISFHFGPIFSTISPSQYGFAFFFFTFFFLMLLLNMAGIQIPSLQLTKVILSSGFRSSLKLYDKRLPNFMIQVFSCKFFILFLTFFCDWTVLQLSSRMYVQKTNINILLFFKTLFLTYDFFLFKVQIMQHFNNLVHAFRKFQKCNSLFLRCKHHLFSIALPFFFLIIMPYTTLCPFNHISSS